MTDLDDRVSRIGAELDGVVSALRALPRDLRVEHGEAVQHLVDTVTFGRLCLAVADAKSISAQAEQAIRDAAEPVVANAEAAVRSKARGNALTDAVQLLPERAVMEAQRDVSSREAALRNDQLRGAS